MTKGDKLLAAAILVLAVVAIALPRLHSLLSSADKAPRQALVMVSGKIVRKIDLSDKSGKSLLVVRGRLGPATLEVIGGKIRMEKAPCPKQICVKQGWIENPGESIICIPGEILVRIEGTAPLDAVTR